MCATAYQRSEPARACIFGPGASSIISDGCEAAFVAKKNSGPCPAHAVPALSSFASNVAEIAPRNSALFDFASSISRVAFDFSGATGDNAHTNSKHATQIIHLCIGTLLAPAIQLFSRHNLSRLATVASLASLPNSFSNNFADIIAPPGPRNRNRCEPRSGDCT